MHFSEWAQIWLQVAGFRRATLIATKLELAPAFYSSMLDSGIAISLKVKLAKRRSISEIASASPSPSMRNLLHARTSLPMAYSSPSTSSPRELQPKRSKVTLKAWRAI
jgi:hypothetical protein